MTNQYTRATSEIQEALKAAVVHGNSKDILEKMNRTDMDAAPRDLKQVQNAKYAYHKEKATTFTPKWPGKGNLVDQTQSVLTSMAY